MSAGERKGAVAAPLRPLRCPFPPRLSLRGGGGSPPGDSSPLSPHRPRPAGGPPPPRPTRPSGLLGQRPPRAAFRRRATAPPPAYGRKNKTPAPPRPRGGAFSLRHPPAAGLCSISSSPRVWSRWRSGTSRTPPSSSRCSCFNAGLGTYQEYKAESAAQSLQQVMKITALVTREGEREEIDKRATRPRRSRHSQVGRLGARRHPAPEGAGAEGGRGLF